MKRREDTPHVAGYLAAFLAPALTGVIVAVTWPGFEDFSVAVYLFAVIFCAGYGGIGPGLLSLLNSFLIAGYFFIQPYYGFWPVSKNSTIRLTILVAVGTSICVISELMHRATRRAEDEFYELKQVEEVLRESQERYKLLFENNPCPVWVFDIETLEFLAVNYAATLYYGYSREEFLNMTIKDIRPPEHVPELMDTVASVREKLKWSGICEHRKKDGRVFDVEITSHDLIFDGRPSRLVLANDVTERKLAGQVIRQREAHLAGVIGSAMDAIVSVDEGQTIILFNAAAEKMFQVPSSEAIGQPLDRFIPDRFRKAHRGYVDDFGGTKATKRAMGSYGTIFGLRSDGKEFPMEASISQIESDGKKIFTVIIRDITEREHAEERNRMLNKELEAFSYSVSHDLRAPLRHINGFSLALLEDYSDVLDETGKNCLREVRGASQEMGLLIDDILELARVSRSEMKREPIDLSHMAHSIMSDLQKSDPDRILAVEIENGLFANGDRRLIQIVLNNLFGNAWKFTSRTAAAEIAFGKQVVSDQTHYFVRDNGAGFDMKYVDKLFGAFQRLHNTTEFEGTGIGLATVQRIVHRHGGRVWAEGSVNAGASFYFTLPGPREVINGHQNHITG